jgi:hypothetical protein
MADALPRADVVSASEVHALRRALKMREDELNRIRRGPTGAELVRRRPPGAAAMRTSHVRGA